MSGADQAYKAAQDEIARVKAAGETELDFGGETFLMLEALPPEISDLTELKELDLFQTQVTDLTPLHDLTGLQWLHLNMTHVSDLSPLRKLSALQELSLNHTQVSDLTPLRDLSALQRLEIDNTPVSDLAALRNLSGLRLLSLTQTEVSDLRPLLSLGSLRRGAKNRNPRAGLYCAACPALLSDPTLHELYTGHDIHDRTLKVLDYLATLPPWPEPLPGEVPQGKATQQKTPKHLKRLSLSDARHILEKNFPMVRDRCQAVVQEIDEGLAIQQTRIPNDERALADHLQVTQSLTVAKAAMIGIHDALPEDFTDQEIDEETVGRFKQAFDAAIDRLQSAAAYIDRPDHTPTYGGLLKLGCSGSVASVLAMAPGVTLGTALPAIYALLYGPEAAKALKGMITTQRAAVPTEEGER